MLSKELSVKINRITLTIIILNLVFIFLGCSKQNNVLPIAFTTTITETATIEVTDTIGLRSSEISNIEGTLGFIYDQIIQSVVYIEISYPEGSYSGSGFVWDTNGNIVTNDHLVDNAENIIVTFYNGSIAEATLKGHDPNSELAVINVDVDPELLKSVTLADSTKLKVGQLAIAIGNPYGYQNSMTVGYISGLGRVLPIVENETGSNFALSDVIQIDTALNPGNSGGVLLDATGKVIGVTSSMVSTSGVSTGIGFAIPSIIVNKVVPSLISKGYYEHPYLGTAVNSLKPNIALAMGLSFDQRGALVQRVMQDSPADQAGIIGGQTLVVINHQLTTIGGDIIIQYEDKIVNSADDLITFLARYGLVGETVNLTVIRNGEEIQLQVIIGIRPNLNI